MLDQILSDSAEPTGPLTDDQIKYLCSAGLHKIVKIMFNRRSRYALLSSASRLSAKSRLDF